MDVQESELSTFIISDEAKCRAFLDQLGYDIYEPVGCLVVTCAFNSGDVKNRNRKLGVDPVRDCELILKLALSKIKFLYLQHEPESDY